VFVPQYPHIEQHWPGLQSASDTHSPSLHSIGPVAQKPSSQHHGLSLGQSLALLQSSVDLISSQYCDPCPQYPHLEQQNRPSSLGSGQSLSFIHSPSPQSLGSTTQKFSSQHHGVFEGQSVGAWHSTVGPVVIGLAVDVGGIFEVVVGEGGGVVVGEGGGVVDTGSG